MQLKEAPRKKLSLNPNMPVLINLSGPGEKEGQRIAVNEIVFVKDLPQIQDLLNTETPEFPQEEINQVNSDNNLTPLEKVQKINQIIQEYYNELQEFENSGGEVLTEEMMLLLSVREYLIQKHNFARTEDESAPYVATSDLQVTIIKTPKGEEIASVSGTSVWG
jgi:hypothetical protein